MDKPAVPRTFASGAYLKIIDKNLYGLYRDILVETDQKDLTGHPLREKTGKSIGPIALLRRAEKGEFVYLRTQHPTTGEQLDLTEVEDPATGR